MADVKNPFTIDNVTRNGFKDNKIALHPDFIKTIWTDMMDKLNVEIDDSADDYVCCHLT